MKTVQQLLDTKLIIPGPFREQARNKLMDTMPNETHLHQFNDRDATIATEAKMAVKSTQYALKRVSTIMGKIKTARTELMADKSLNDIAVLANSWRYAKSKRGEIQSILVEPSVKIAKEITRIDSIIDKPIADEAADSPYAQETRQMLRDMNKTSERFKFLSNAIQSQEWQTVSQVLGAPTHLSGIETQQKQQLLDLYKNTRFKNAIEVKQGLQYADSMMDAAINEAEAFISKQDDPIIQEAITKHENAKNATEGMSINQYQ